MLSRILFDDRIWSGMPYLPFTLTFLAGVLLALGIGGSRGWEPTCRRCRHDLRGSNSDRCPECGADLSRPRAVRSGRWSPRWKTLAMGIALLVVSAATLPPWSLNGQWIRQRLLTRLDAAELLNAPAGRGVNEAARRVRSGDEEFRQALLDECFADIARDRTGSLLAVRGGFFRHATNGFPWQPEQIDRLARIIRDHVAKSEWTPAVAWQFVAGVDREVGDLLFPALATDDVLLLDRIDISAPTRAMVGRSVSVRIAFQPRGVILAALDLPVELEKASWRRADAGAGEPWQEAPRSTWHELDQPAVHLTFQEPGAVEVRVEGTITVPESGRYPKRRVAFERTARIEVVTIAALPVTKVRGGDERVAIQGTLENLIVTDQGEGGLFATVSMQRTSLRRQGARRTTTVQYGARMAIGQDGHWHDFGTMHATQSGCGISGVTGPGAIDPNRPFVVRLEPDVEQARLSGTDELIMLDEVAELRYSKAGERPQSVQWFDPALPAATPW